MKMKTCFHSHFYANFHAILWRAIQQQMHYSNTANFICLIIHLKWRSSSIISKFWCFKCFFPNSTGPWPQLQKGRKIPAGHNVANQCVWKHRLQAGLHYCFSHTSKGVSLMAWFSLFSEVLSINLSVIKRGNYHVKYGRLLTFPSAAYWLRNNPSLSFKNTALSLQSDLFKVKLTMYYDLPFPKWQPIWLPNALFYFIQYFLHCWEKNGKKNSK